MNKITAQDAVLLLETPKLKLRGSVMEEIVAATELHPKSLIG
jgi:hypothetical protein